MPGAPDCGWFGKLPALGDFAQRRLEQDFITHWDTWLQAVIVDSQRTLGGNWLATYLRAPVWRFVLAPGVVDGRSWSGILCDPVVRGRAVRIVCEPGAMRSPRPVFAKVAGRTVKLQPGTVLVSGPGYQIVSCNVA